MKVLAPSLRTRSSLRALPLVDTTRPMRAAMGMAMAPRLPVPPEMKSDWPAFACMSSSACMAVSAVRGTHAASSIER